MTFNIGWGCAELQILKKWKWPNWVDYCDETFASTLILTRLSNVIWYWLRHCRGSNSEKQWNWPYLLKLFEYFDKIMHKHCYWHELDRGIAKCHLSSAEAMPMSKSQKQVNLTLSAFGTFWYTFVLILKRTLHIFICKKKKKSADTFRYHIFVCNIGSAILHFRM